jgi:hypothetical protein
MLNHFLTGKTSIVTQDESQRIADAMEFQAVQMSNLKVQEWRATLVCVSSPAYTVLTQPIWED